MADIPTIMPDVKKLGSQLDKLEDALEPLLGNISEMASQLPLLDRAKLFSLTAYAIESLLFSSIKVQGGDAQNHAVYAELKRIQQYFAKIKAAEEPETKRTLTVNQEAAARILKADLVIHPSTHHLMETSISSSLPPTLFIEMLIVMLQSDNKTLSAKLAEKIAEERAKALLKAAESKKRSAEDAAQTTNSETNESPIQNKKPKTKGKGKGKSRK
ncbi:hypothetical protein CFAM422_007650 [Trichoderma lentiforme]|uniref:Exosome complex protein n=1 Tax=Trichoderma lentiforme TaxID=1567552 RepID=A0A9P4XD37_9HYPO|nr:hypothetical protein CFAM422_007650 [Trichoderma lentiforme]